MQGETQNSIHVIPKKGDGEGHKEVIEIDNEWWFRGNGILKESEEKRFNKNELEQHLERERERVVANEGERASEIV